MIDKIKKNYVEYLTYLLVLTLFFSKALPNILVAVLAVIALIHYKSIKINSAKINSTHVLILLLIFLVLKSLFYGTLSYDFKVYKGMLLFFLVGFIFRNSKDQLKLIILISVNAAILYSLILILNFYLHNRIFPFGNTAEVNNLLVLERPYLGFIVVLGILLALEKVFIYKKNKWFWIINAICLFSFILLISARISIITLFVVFGIYLFFYVKLQWYKKLLITMCLFVIFGLVITSNKNIAARFFIKDTIEESLQIASDYEPRIVIWNCAYNMTQNADFTYLTGLEGYNKIKENLLACYATKIENESKKEYFLSEKFNSHNQFIDIFLIGGCIGLLLFLCFLTLLIKEIKADFFKIAIVTTFILFLCVENIFYRQLGCYLFGIFILCLAQKKRKVNE